MGDVSPILEILSYDFPLARIFYKIQLRLPLSSERIFSLILFKGKSVEEGLLAQKVSSTAEKRVVITFLMEIHG